MSEDKTEMIERLILKKKFSFLSEDKTEMIERLILKKKFFFYLRKKLR